MGLFGFGKKKRQSEEAAEAAAEENDKADEAISETAEASAGGIQETILPEPSDEYDGRGDEHGPWDVDDENVPDYDEYLDMGAYYLPFLQGIELRVKANRATAGARHHHHLRILQRGDRSLRRAEDHGTVG